MQKLKTLAMTLALTAGATGLAAQDYEWSGRVGEGQAIEVQGVLGDIEAMAARGNEVEVVAEIREHRRGRQSAAHRRCGGRPR